VRRLLAGAALLSIVAGCTSTPTVPPRVAAALGGQPRGCTITCPTGTWCDADTGTCIGTTAGGATQTSSAHASTSTAVDAAPGGHAFSCTTVHGLGDEIVASDGDAATRACEAMNGEPCTCRPTGFHAARE
jgi:hypothetical protein